MDICECNFPVHLGVMRGLCAFHTFVSCCFVAKPYVGFINFHTDLSFLVYTMTHSEIMPTYGMNPIDPNEPCIRVSLKYIQIPAYIVRSVNPI